DPQVRSLAEMILADHERSIAQLNEATAQPEPPLEPTASMSAEHQAKLGTLRSASAADFDRLYLSQQVTAHEQALNLAVAYSTHGEVAPLRRHAATVSGPIQQHLARARSLAAQAASPAQP